MADLKKKSSFFTIKGFEKLNWIWCLGKILDTFIYLMKFLPFSFNFQFLTFRIFSCFVRPRARSNLGSKIHILHHRSINDTLFLMKNLYNNNALKCYCISSKKLLGDKSWSDTCVRRYRPWNDKTTKTNESYLILKKKFKDMSRQLQNWIHYYKPNFFNIPLFSGRIFS